jgi:D-serine deaminase-like pyridoxal phosphate-dependent protein
MNIVIETPTLVLNKSTCLRNIELMAEKAKRHHLRFRPHFKTHQSLEIGSWFRQFGVNAITVSSLKMAEFFAADEWNDITIAFPFNPYEVDALNKLAANATINIIADDVRTIELIKNRLIASVGIYIEISTGYNRSGIPSTSLAKIDQLIDAIESVENLTLKGFLSHAGHTYYAKSKNEIQNIHFDEVLKMGNLKRHYSTKFPSLEISIGDTPGCSLSEHFSNIDEIRPGNFVFYDLMQHNLGACHLDDIALRMICPVVSKQKMTNEIIIYGGAIHFSKDFVYGADSKPLFGRIILHQKDNEKTLLDATNYLCRLTQEHGVLKVNSELFNAFEIGDLVEIIPVHSCLTAYEMGRMTTTKGEEIVLMNR